MEKNIDRERKIYLIRTVLITIGIFIVIYNKYLFGDKLYLYYDVGGDTMDIYYPAIHNLVGQIKNGHLDLFNLQMGLGTDLYGMVGYILNPFTLILILLPIKYLPLGLILMAMAKAIVTSIFAFLFFDRILKTKLASMLSAIIWTFSGYMILWGQHYQFATVIVYFTILMYIVQRILEGSRKHKFLLPVIIMLFSYSVYFLYTSGIYVAVYSIFYLINKKQNIKNIVIKLLEILSWTVLGLMMGAVIWVPWIGLFLSSNRTGDLATNVLDLLKPYNLDYILSFITRIFSNDLLIYGQEVPEAINYYGDPMIASSILLFFSIVYLLWQKKYRKITISILLISISFVIIPMGSSILTLTTFQRWNYILIFTAVIAIGLFLDTLSEKIKKKYIIISSFSAVTLLLVATEIAVKQEIIINEAMRSLILIIITAYIIIFLFSSKENLKRYISIMICLELILLNYPTVNHRLSPNKEQLNNEFYNDGTKEIIAEINKSDNTLFRVNKDYLSYGLSDSLMQGYNSTNIYSSLIPKVAYDFIQNSGGITEHNVYRVESGEYLLNTLLGEKYILLDNEINNTNYQLIHSLNNKKVYINNNYLPFGYMYFNEVNKESLEDKTDFDKRLLLTRAFYETESNKADINELSFEEVEKDRIYFNKDLKEHIIGAYNSEISGEDILRITPHSNDPIIEMNFNFEKDIEQYAQYLYVEIYSYATTEQRIQVFFETENGYNELNSSSQIIYPGINHIYIPIFNQNTDKIRLDPIDSQNDVDILQLKQINIDVRQDISDLKKIALNNIKFENSTLAGDINNNTSSDGMLCIPLVYSENWKATIDNNSTQIININGGLMGIKIEPGEHNIKLQYTPRYFSVCKYISLVSIAVYSIFMILILKKRIREGKNSDTI